MTPIELRNMLRHTDGCPSSSIGVMPDDPACLCGLKGRIEKAFKALELLENHGEKDVLRLIEAGQRWSKSNQGIFTAKALQWGCSLSMIMFTGALIGAVFLIWRAVFKG